MDFYDRAQEVEALFRDKALASQAAKMAPTTTISATYCIDCGNEIPSDRRVAVPGVQTCTECQTVRETPTATARFK